MTPSHLYKYKKLSQDSIINHHVKFFHHQCYQYQQHQCKRAFHGLQYTGCQCGICPYRLDLQHPNQTSKFRHPSLDIQIRHPDQTFRLDIQIRHPVSDIQIQTFRFRHPDQTFRFRHSDSDIQIRHPVSDIQIQTSKFRHPVSDTPAQNLNVPCI